MASVSRSLTLYAVSRFLLILLVLLLIHESQSCPESIYFECPDIIYKGQLPTSHFTNPSLLHDPDCHYLGPCELTCDHDRTKINCTKSEELPYLVLDINPSNLTIAVDNYHADFDEWEKDLCIAYKALNESFPNFEMVSLRTWRGNETFLGCPNHHGDHFCDPKYCRTCKGDAIVYGPYDYGNLPAGIRYPNCMLVIKYWPPNEVIAKPPRASNQLPPLPGSSPDSGGRGRKGKPHLVPIICSVLSGIAIIVSIILIVVYWRQRNKQTGSTTLSSRIMFLNHTRSDLEEGSMAMNNGVTVFSYAELQEVTNNFDTARELGEGGFGIVYHGKLKDGREVAVKRMYEKNYKQVEQFMNEIQILTNVHHQNLVTLYGSTSRHSRELLLVYEYIPNGTVADHLHGNQSKSALLLWPTRMKIAIETATALSYLHYNDIIHRDIKTNNILLDRNFCAKVADFGLSRLFPADVSHVSTAPQGTPGYLDPEYHQCYHLTDKSDVYSFGVVLIELISSLPAIDMGRHRHEVNLSNYAMNKIQCSAFDELVDPNLGYEKNFKVRRMTTLVAELAFQCLQHEREVRPSMGEVLETLKRIDGVDYDELEEEEMGKKTSIEHITNQTPSTTDSDDVELRG